MDRVTVVETRARFSHVLREVDHERPQVITKNGHDVAVVVSWSWFEKVNRIMDELLQAELDEAAEE